jgi:hypothetical protein
MIQFLLLFGYGCFTRYVFGIRPGILASSNIEDHSGRIGEDPRHYYDISGKNTFFNSLMLNWRGEYASCIHSSMTVFEWYKAKFGG